MGLDGVDVYPQTAPRARAVRHNADTRLGGRHRQRRSGGGVRRPANTGATASCAAGGLRLPV